MAPRPNPSAGAFPIPVERPAQQRHDPTALYAALDLGTNSCRMLIAQPKGAQFHVIDSFSRSVQLGEGLESSCRLSQGAMRRAISALHICRKKLNTHQVRRMRLVATEACRRAFNARDFIHQVRRETGLRLDIIAPEEEARLAVISCGPLVSINTEQLLVVDIGGGSTELVWIDLSTVPPVDRPRALMRLHSGFEGAGPFPAARVVDWISVPLGVATLREQFSDVEDDRARFALMSCHFEEALADFSPYHHEPQDNPEHFQIISTSGTVTTVAASHLGLTRYDRSRVDGLRMTNAQIDTVIDRYLRLGPTGRRRDPHIGRDRQTLIMSGSAILKALLRVWPTDRVSVADRGLREGLLYAQMSADGVLETGRSEMPKEPGRSGRGARALHERVKTARGRKLSSTRWLQRQLNDPYVQRAKAEGYRGRAAFKLIELDDRFRFLRPGARVVDLGSAPGGWAQVAVPRVNALGDQAGKPRGRVLGIDLKAVEPIPGAELHQLDFMAEDAESRIKSWLDGPADVVMSDMAAPATGHKQTDHLRIIALCEAAADLAFDVLEPGGTFVAKVLAGGAEGGLQTILKRRFDKVAHAKPGASRADSSEKFVVASGFRG